MFSSIEEPPAAASLATHLMGCHRWARLACAGLVAFGVHALLAPRPKPVKLE
jgi:hypothetical protein